MKYRVRAPSGNIVVPQEVMDEEELRNFIPQIVQEPEQVEIWKEKAMKDEIDALIELLQTAGFTIEHYKDEKTN